jgi:hypothetical protein
MKMKPERFFPLIGCVPAIKMQASYVRYAPRSPKLLIPVRWWEQEVTALTLRGRIKNGVVILDPGPSLPDGTLVQVTPLSLEAGNPLAVIAAMEAEPHLSPEDVAELERAIGAGRRPAAELDPFGEAAPGPD